MSEVVVFATPVAVGHINPLVPVARRLVERGYSVIWAISGDPDEPASKWEPKIVSLGAHFIDVDALVEFNRTDMPPGTMSNAVLMRRILARANDVAPAAAEAIAAAAAGRRIVGGIYDFFALFGYVAMKRLGIPRVSALISAFPSGVALEDRAYLEDEYFVRELGKLRASGVGHFDTPLRLGFVPDDPAVHVVATTSKHLCLDAPDFVNLVGVPREIVPDVDHVKACDADLELVAQLERARAGGRRVVLLSMGTMVMRMAPRMDPAVYPAHLTRLYSTIAKAAFRCGAVVVASTGIMSAPELGIDEATLGADARDRVFAMPFVPQPLLFARGLVDVMLMHGGANTFHETTVSAVPVLVSPVFGDQGAVARAVAALGVGAVIEVPPSRWFASFTGTQPLEQIANETLPAMLAAGESRWKTAVTRLAALVREENGVEGAVAFVLGQ